MFKTLVTIIRGEAFASEERLKDRHALAILDQQLRDAAAIVARARRALALAIAQEQMEAKRLGETRVQIVALEGQAVAALQGGREDLAARVAQTLAGLEADAVAAAKAQELFEAEIAKLDAQARRQTSRLAELQRGRRVAQAAQAARAARRGGYEPAGACDNTLADAEATLARLREQQAEAEAAEAALERLTLGEDAERLAETLAREGFGGGAHPSAADILARLKEKAAGRTL